jgi:membrane associated rhomboid family serine protease
MTSDGLAPQVESFPLRGGRRALTLHVSGMRHAASWLAGGESFTGFEEITDVALGARGLKIGTTRNVVLLPRRLFLDASAPERLAQTLIERIGRLPGGTLQLARMAELEQLARSTRRPRATWALMALCVLIYVLEAVVGPELQNEGHFGSTLFFAGEHWRLVTANLLHAGLFHLLFNVIGLFVMGELVERPLGASRTIVIMAASALGAMAAGAAAGYEYAVGASGIVCGLFGAAFYLELRVPERLPAAWRAPRRLLYVVLAGEAATSALIPSIAGACHVGGFFAGAAAAALLTPRVLARTAAPTWIRALATALVLAFVGTGFTLVREIRGGGEVLARRAERLLSLPSVSPVILNNTAWMIVTANGPTAEQIQLALRSAQRAVAQTDRADPNFLDTLAESQYLAGRGADAIETIDEAIALAPGEAYFVEQRRRFTGERDYDDRPAPPSEPAQGDEQAEPWLEEPGPGHPGLPPGHPPVDEDPGISV